MKPRGVLSRVGDSGFDRRHSLLGHHFGSKRTYEAESVSHRWPRHLVSTAISFPPTACSGPSHGRITIHPPGLAVSPDGKRLYIALDDRDEVAEADIVTRKVLRRAKVPGRTFRTGPRCERKEVVRHLPAGRSASRAGYCVPGRNRVAARRHGADGRRVLPDRRGGPPHRGQLNVGRYFGDFSGATQGTVAARRGPGAVRGRRHARTARARS